MKKAFSLFVGLFFFVLTSFSQSNTSSDLPVLDLPNQGQIVSVKVSFKGNLPENVLKLKDDLYIYEDKIFNINFIEDSEVLKFEYNHNMLIEDLIELFDKHSIQYTKTDKLKKG